MSLHRRRFVASALGTEPLSLGLVGQLDAGEMEPLDGAQVVVATDHLAVGDLEKLRVEGSVRPFVAFYLC